MRSWICLMLLCKSLKLSLHFFFMILWLILSDFSLLYWFFLLTDEVWSLTPLVNFLFRYFSVPKFLFSSFLYFLFVGILISFIHHFLSLLSIFIMVILNSLSGNSYKYFSFGSVSGDFFFHVIGLCSAVSSCSFISFYWDMHIWQNSHLSFTYWPYTVKDLYQSSQIEILVVSQIFSVNIFSLNL